MLDYTMMDTKRLINNMIYLSIMSYSVLSGCGNCSMPDINDIAQLDRVTQHMPPAQRPYNIFFTNGLYKKCIPRYEFDVQEPYNFQSFKWIDKKSKKVIDLKVMSASIVSCCSLIERIFTYEIETENPHFITFILYKTALNQANFIQHYLKVGSMFYHGEDASDSGSQEPHILVAPDDPDRISQFAVLHAFSALHQLCCYHIFDDTSLDNELYSNLGLLPGLITNLLDNLENCSSKELSQAGLHLIEIYKKSEAHSELIRKTLGKIAKALCQRITQEGDIARNNAAEEPSSLNTLANCLNLLSQLNYMFGSKICYTACERLYRTLDSKWDERHGIFKLKSSNKQSFSLKNISSILAALFSYLKTIDDMTLKRHISVQINSFSEAALVKSGICNGQCSPILQQNKIELNNALKHTEQWAPVFNKDFEYKMSKGKHYCEAGVFKADHVMPACAVLLNCINN